MIGFPQIQELSEYRGTWKSAKGQPAELHWPRGGAAGGWVDRLSWKKSHKCDASLVLETREQ